MDSSSSRGLFFLLSLGAVPLACTDGGGESESEGTATTTATGTTTAGTTTTDGTGTATTGTATEGTATEGTATDGTTATSTATTETSTTGEPGGICEDYAAKQVECFPRGSLDEYLGYCQEALTMYAEVSPECLAAGEAYYECEAAARCDAGEACDQAFSYLFLACAPEPGPTCTAFATKLVECSMYRPDMIPYYAGSCQMSIQSGTEEYGEACGTAYEEWYACLAALECAEFENEDACPTEFAEVVAQCQ